MSNIGNKIRAGFYAMPESQGDIVKQLISFKGDCSVLDPTCGEGAILKQLVEGQEAHIHTYGVELDKGRAAVAKEILDTVIQAPIESMVISNNDFGLVFLNPPYDHSIKTYEDEKSERKEYIELERATRYLAAGGIMIYTIPSYRFAYKKIAKHLACYYEEGAIMRFTDEEYPVFKQCVFIGKKKKKTQGYMLNKNMFDFFMQMDHEEFVQSKVSPLSRIIGAREWQVPRSETNIKTFYSKIDSKDDYIDLIAENKGFQAFIERTKPKKLELGGNPPINIATGQLALLLASGAINGVIGEGSSLHAVQGVETVGTENSEEHSEHGTTYKTKTKRSVSVKVVLPSGIIKKFV